MYDFQIKAIKADAPLRQLLVAERRLWMVGKENVWIYSFDGRRLEKVALSVRAQKPQMIVHNEQVFLADDTTLYAFSTSPFSVVSYHVPHDRGFSYRLQSLKDRLYWVRSTGVFEWDRGTQKVALLHPHHIRNRNLLLAYEAHRASLWMADEGVLRRHDYEAQRTYDVDEGQVPEAQELFVSGHDVLVQSRHDVGLWSSSGKKTQMIPLVKGLVLQGAAWTNDYHAYLLQTGVLEIFDLKKQEAYPVKLSPQIPQSAQSFSFSPFFVAWINHGQPWMFEVLFDGANVAIH